MVVLERFERIDAGQLAVRMDQENGTTAKVIKFSPDQYADFDHGYACTIHKSQGATVGKAYVLGSKTMDKHLTYVAMTRHKEQMLLYADPSALRKMERNQTAGTFRHFQPPLRTNKRSGPER